MNINNFIAVVPFSAQENIFKGREKNMSFFDKIKEIVTESDDDEYDDFYEDDKKDKSIGIAPPARDRFSCAENGRAYSYNIRTVFNGSFIIVAHTH